MHAAFQQMQQQLQQKAAQHPRSPISLRPPPSPSTSSTPPHAHAAPQVLPPLCTSYAPLDRWRGGGTGAAVGMRLYTLAMCNNKAAVHLPETEAQHRPRIGSRCHKNTNARRDSSLVLFTHSAPRSQSGARLSDAVEVSQRLEFNTHAVVALGSGCRGGPLLSALRPRVFSCGFAHGAFCLCVSLGACCCSAALLADAGSL